MGINLSLGEFTRYVNAIKKTWDFHDETLKLSQKYDCDIGILNTPDCADALLKLLEYVMEDNTDLIGYFCYELNFGRDWREGCITDADGKDVRLSTIEELYKELIK